MRLPPDPDYPLPAAPDSRGPLIGGTPVSHWLDFLTGASTENLSVWPPGLPAPSPRGSTILFSSARSHLIVFAADKCTNEVTLNDGYAGTGLCLRPWLRGLLPDGAWEALLTLKAVGLLVRLGRLLASLPGASSLLPSFLLFLVPPPISAFFIPDFHATVFCFGQPAKTCHDRQLCS